MKSLLIFLINLIYSNGVRPLNSSASNAGNPKVRNHGEGRLLTPQSLNVKLGPRRKGHKG